MKDHLVTRLLCIPIDNVTDFIQGPGDGCLVPVDALQILLIPDEGVCLVLRSSVEPGIGLGLIHGLVSLFPCSLVEELPALYEILGLLFHRVDVVVVDSAVQVFECALEAGTQIEGYEGWERIDSPGSLHLAGNAIERRQVVRDRGLRVTEPCVDGYGFAVGSSSGHRFHLFNW